jgi:hypothetical protein
VPSPMAFIIQIRNCFLCENQPCIHAGISIVAQTHWNDSTAQLMAAQPSGTTQWHNPWQHNRAAQFNRGMTQ